MTKRRGKLKERTVNDSYYQKVSGNGEKMVVLDKRKSMRRASRVLKCENCGILMQVELCEYNRGRGRFCSHSCVSKHTMTGMSGPRNNNWKGGRSKNSAVYAKKYRKQHPNRKKAYEVMRRALRSGRIKRAPCKVCGSEKVQAFYRDWNKPLKVEWYCKKHHIEKCKKWRKRRDRREKRENS